MLNFGRSDYRKTLRKKKHAFELRKTKLEDEWSDECKAGWEERKKKTYLRILNCVNTILKLSIYFLGVGQGCDSKSFIFSIHKVCSLCIRQRRHSVTRTG